MEPGNISYQKQCRFTACNKPFEAARLNQEFCCRAHQVRNNNAHARNRREKVKTINAALLKNSLILERYFKKAKPVTWVELERAGYNALFHTHKLKDTELNAYGLFCYSFGIFEIENKQLKIVNHDLHRSNNQ